MLTKIDEVVMKAQAYSSQALIQIEKRCGRMTQTERKEMIHQLELAYINGAKDVYKEIPRLTTDKLAA